MDYTGSHKNLFHGQLVCAISDRESHVAGKNKKISC